MRGVRSCFPAGNSRQVVIFSETFKLGAKAGSAVTHTLLLRDCYLHLLVHKETLRAVPPSGVQRAASEDFFFPPVSVAAQRYLSCEQRPSKDPVV